MSLIFLSLPIACISSCYATLARQTSSYQSNSFIRSIFANLSSTSDGGALSISVSGSSTLINYCVFYGCSSSSDGGAVYISSSMTTITRTCFQKCVCYYYGTAFHIVSDPNCGVFSNLYANCPYISSSYATVSRVFSFNSMNFTGTLFNITGCENDGGTSGVHAESGVGLTLSYVNCLKCTGMFLMSFRTSSFGSPVQSVNIINNSISSNLLYIDSNSITIQNWCCINSQGTFSSVSSGYTLSIYSLIYDLSCGTFYVSGATGYVTNLVKTYNPTALSLGVAFPKDCQTACSTSNFTSPLMLQRLFVQLFALNFISNAFID